MGDAVQIWHNPRCSKSRQTLAILQERGIEPEILSYLDAPPSVQTLRAVAGQLGITAREWIRRKDAAAAGLADETSEDVLFQAMHDNPRLIERPVVITAQGARLGRPPEQVLEIL